MADKYPFLSDEWLDAAKKIREESSGAAAAPAHSVRMNQVITEVPFGDGTIREDDPRLLAVGVVACVGQYSHFHRTDRIRMPLPELAAFVARYVVHSLAADDQARDQALRAAGALAPTV